MHAIAYVRKPESAEVGGVVALVGNDRFLKQQAIKTLTTVVCGEPDSLEAVSYSGRDADLTSVLDELRMVSMWGDRKLVVIDQADDFVSKNRPGLEAYAKSPAKKSVLAIDVKSFPKTTKLAKAVAKSGLILECASLSESELARHLVSVAKDEHQKSLTRPAAALMVQLAGTELGLLEQELRKLVSYIGDEKSINEEDVRTLVGGWKAETTWVMINALRDGRIDEALNAFSQLLVSGEAPQKILGGIHFVFRKFARATDLASSGQQLNAALKSAGVFPRDLSASSHYLRRIGRPQAESLFRWLLEADGNIKGGRRIDGRIELEELMIRLSGVIASQG